MKSAKSVDLPWLAWLAHLYTATGAVLAFLSMRAIVVLEYREAFLWMYAATIVDATDGWLARRLRVSERLPHFSGTKLDDIVDYLTFVFVPAFLLYRAGTLPASSGAAVACGVLLASAYGFSRENAKTADHFFTGFPSYWNITAFYLYAAGMSPALNASLVLLLCALVFVPIGYVYPSRTPTLGRTTVALGVVWGLLVLWMVWELPQVRGWLLAGSLAFPAYYAVLSFILHARRRSRT